MGQLLDAIYAEQKQQLQKQTPQPKKKKGLVGDILSSIIDPAVATGRNIGATGAALGALGLQTFAGNTKIPSWLGGGGYTGSEIANSIAEGLTKDFSKTGVVKASQGKTGEAVTDVAKQAANAASYAIPFGKAIPALNIGGRALTPAVGGILGKAVLPGAAVGGLQSLSEKDATLESVGKGALFGGAAGGALFGAGKVASKVTGKLGKTGEQLQQGVVQPYVHPNPTAAKTEAELTKEASKMFKGASSAQGMREQSATLFDSLTNQVKAKLPKIKETISLKKDLLPTIKANLDDVVNKAPGFASAKAEALALIKKTSSGDVVSATTLNSIKTKLSNRVSKAFTKVSKDLPLTPQEEAYLAVWEGADTLMRSSFPAIKKLTTQQSVLYRLAPGLNKAAKTGINFSPLGIPLGKPLTRPLQAAATGIGKASSAVGGLGENLQNANMNPLLQQILGQGAARFGASAANQPQEVPQSDLMQLLGADQGQPQGMEQGMMGDLSGGMLGQQASANPYPIENYIQDIQRDPQNAALYKEIFNQYQAQYEAEKPVKQSAAMEKASMTLNNAEVIADQIEAKISEASTGLLAGGGLGFLGNATRGNLAGNEYEYNQFRESMIGPLARAISGEVGVLNEGDIRRAEGLLPKLSESQETIRNKIALLRSTIAQRKAQMQSSGGGGEDYSALMQMLSGGQ